MPPAPGPGHRPVQPGGPGAGLPPVRPHDLRHDTGSPALAAGVDLKVVSGMLGHSGTAITRDSSRRQVPTQRSITAFILGVRTPLSAT